MDLAGIPGRQARTRCARAIRDELLIGELKTVHESEFLGLRGQEDARGDDPARLSVYPRSPCRRIGFVNRLVG